MNKYLEYSIKGIGITLKGATVTICTAAILMYFGDIANGIYMDHKKQQAGQWSQIERIFKQYDRDNDRKLNEKELSDFLNHTLKLVN